MDEAGAKMCQAQDNLCLLARTMSHEVFQSELSRGSLGLSENFLGLSGSFLDLSGSIENKANSAQL